jgi:hypothetical protein
MKRLLKTLLPMVMLVSTFEDAQSLIAHSRDAAASQEWGATAKGVHVALWADRSTYALGEDIPIHIRVENISATEAICGDSIEVTVQDEDGPLRPRPAHLPSGMITTFRGPSWRPPPYVPHKPLTFEKTLDQAGLLPDKPGSYKLTVTWSPYIAHAQSCGLVEPVAPQKYVSATSIESRII